MPGSYESPSSALGRGQWLTFLERANWPIQEHWNRVITLVAAWSGASQVADPKWKNGTQIWDKISNGLDYWFDNDYEPSDCMGEGGNE